MGENMFDCPPQTHTSPHIHVLDRLDPAAAAAADVPTAAGAVRVRIRVEG